MKRTGTEKPTLSYALIVRNAAETLEQCLKSLRERTPDAEIVVVDTCSGDLPTGQQSNDGPFDLRYPMTHQIAQKYADVWEEYKGPHGDWNEEMFAFDDAAAARNHSFDLCTGSWICWVDADDIIAGPDEAEKLLKLNNRWKPGRDDRVADKNAPEQPSLDGLLKWVDVKLPNIDGFKAPYLYQANEDGSAITWQERERIVKNNGRWHWQRPAHEILVPKDVRDYEKMHSLSHLLFVHKKKFSNEDKMYSLQRHFNILIKEYDAGTRHVQGLLYLENFSIFLCPQRRTEFIHAAYEAAAMPVDRARVLIRAGNFAIEQGFYLDAIESFAAATTIAADFPDGWVSGAAAHAAADNPLKAAEWLMRAAQCPGDCVVSDVNPRSLVIELPVRAGLHYLKASQRFMLGGHVPQAVQALENAVTLAQQVMKHPAVGTDIIEATMFHNLFENELSAIKASVAIKFLHEYLVRNDETQKAMKLLDIVPHNAKDFPAIAEIEKWAVPMQRHLIDDEAYRKFYDEIGTDIVSNDIGLEYKTALARVRFLIDWLRDNKPDAEILEAGPFDGITGLPVLRALPEVNYTGVETKADALERFVERAIHFGVNDRLTTHHALLADPSQLGGKLFDVVVFYEVIEHVPDPVAAISKLFSFLKPGGKLFVSTPWGAFDRGHPPHIARDPRGHVRAMMQSDLVDTIEHAGGRIVELSGDKQHHNYGDTTYLMAEKIAANRKLNPSAGGAAFYVPSALWPWNATHVEQTGIGASEETIVALARHMGKLGRDVEVYGPVPTHSALVDEEVRDGVKYWHNAKIRFADRRKSLVISRAPSIGTLVEHPKKLLWLQDAWYPDLTPAVLSHYQKVVVLTEWHKALMHQNHGVPLEQMVICENFLLESHFRVDVERQKNKFIYASSPDRGLINLLKMWPEIRKQIPDAELHIFYGWEGCMKLGSNADPGWVERYRKIRSQFLQLRYQQGIVERGRVNHVTIAKEFKSSAAWLYPSAFDETGCLTAAKSLAGGCVPVCTPRAALNETAASPVTEFVSMPADMDVLCNGVGVEFHPEWNAYVQDFVSGVVSAAALSEETRKAVAEVAIEKYRLETVWPKWSELIGS